MALRDDEKLLLAIAEEVVRLTFRGRDAGPGRVFLLVTAFGCLAGGLGLDLEGGAFEAVDSCAAPIRSLVAVGLRVLARIRELTSEFMLAGAGPLHLLAALGIVLGWLTHLSDGLLDVRGAVP